jgi:hypothetical protein
MTTQVPVSSTTTTDNKFNYNQMLNSLTQMPSKNQLFEFMESNNYIAKLTFIVFIIFILMVITQLILRIILYVYSPKQDIILLPGSINADQPRTIIQNNITNSSNYIIPSTDRKYGIECTWSVWIYIKKLNIQNTYSNIFFKGLYNPTLCNNINIPVNAPGLYIYNDPLTNSATLYILMDTYNSPSAYIDSNNQCTVTDNKIPHIPLNSWVNIVLNLYGSTLDVYINGTIAKSIKLDGVPKQNNGDVYIGSVNGFNGNISSLRYISRKLYINEIQELFRKGPNKTSLDNERNYNTSNNYFSLNWYTNNV